MDLLNENKYEEKQPSKGKKMVLMLLILSVIAVIIVIALMMYMGTKEGKKMQLSINGQSQDTSQGLIISDDQGYAYISLKELANIVGYEYYSNEYNKAGEDQSKCYIKNEKLISGFEKDSKKIYKYEEDTYLDYQYYELNYNILMYNNKLYIALADLQQALNMVCTKSQDNVITIQTTEKLVEQYTEKLKDTGYSIAPDQNNKKAISYGWIIVSKNNVWSVLDSKLEEIVGSKYASIYFDEQNLEFIVSNSSGQFGIITKTGAVKNSLKYDNIEILNYENMLYKITNNKKYGIMKEDGTLLTDIIYDDIGYPENSANKIQYTLIIPELDGKSGETIVVKQDKKYGLIYLSNGKEFIPCNELDKIYAIKDRGNIEYKFEIDKTVDDLQKYIEYINSL